MAKLLLLIAVFAVVVLLLKNYQRSLARQRDEGLRDEASSAASGSEDMVRCAHCGIHLPRSEGFLSQGRHFCSDEHRRLGVAHGRDKGEG